MIRFRFFSSLIEGLKTKDSFIQNFAVVFSGKSVIFLIGFLLTPVIARIYSPEAYGTYAIYSSLVLNLSILSSLNLTNAFIVSKQSDFLPLLRSSFFLITTFSILVVIVFVILGEKIFELLGEEILGTHWYLVPVGIFLTATCNLMGHWNVREKVFRLSTVVSVSETLGTKGASMSIGLITNGMSMGLVFGELIGKILLILMETVLILKRRIVLLVKGFRFREDMSIIMKYKDYPTLLLPSLWLNQATSSTLIFSFAIIFPSELVGSYSMAVGLLMIPVVLVANAAQPVLMQKIVELKDQNGDYQKTVERFIFSLTTLLFVPIVSLVVIGPPIIRVFLGSDWNITADVVAVLSPMVLFNLLLIPLNGVLIAIEKNKQVLIINSIRLGIALIVVLMSWSFKLDFAKTLLVLVLGTSIGSSFCISYALRNASVTISRRLILVFVSYALGFTILFGISDLI